MMKKFLIAAAAIATVAGAAGAASAQPYGYGYGNDGYRGGYDNRYDNRWERRGDSRELNARQHALRVAVDRGVRAGRLSQYEARTLRRQIEDINRLERQYRNTNGLNRNEVNILHERLDNLERRLGISMRYSDGYGRGGPRGW
jgi:hypothetical protein